MVIRLSTNVLPLGVITKGINKAIEDIRIVVLIFTSIKVLQVNGY